ncbi:MAG: hypothetical protein FWD92_03490 [Methanomassiliicoccaceae archaeon]|nr:hypothetical protein [Methanomassiliicoccaceae archaeon]
MAKGITLMKVLDAINGSNVRRWFDEDTLVGIPWSLKVFTTVMIETETINSSRNIKEWWSMLHDAGYFIERNQYVSVTVPERIALKLEITLPARREERRG